MKSLHTALINIRRTPYQALVAITMITITFFVGYILSFVLLGADQILKFFETRPQVIGFFKIATEQSAVESLASDFKNRDFVKEVKVVSKQEALDIYQKDNQDNPLLLELVTADILPASIEVAADDASNLPRIKEALQASSDIEEVVLQQDIIDKLISWTNSVRIIGISLVSILALTSFLLMTIIIGLKVANKKATIGIMNLIGASASYIVSPFVYEGMVYSLIGSTIGWLGSFLLLTYSSTWLQSFIGSIIEFPLPIQLFLWQLSIGTGFGIMLGSFASLLAVRRLIKS